MKIKFRAWIPAHCKMYSVKYMYFDSENVSSIEGEWINPDSNKKYTYTFGQNEFILLQYVGVGDHNGKDVYEGDIVFVEDIWGKHIGVIDNISGIPSTWEGNIGKGCYTIIGNIYENIEYLKEEVKHENKKRA
jgi:uncharacterized phage protein (TIGR01671 family)